MNDAQRQGWLEERRTGLGGSDSPVVLGVSPFKSRTELWEEKLGRTADPDPTPAMERGTYLEDVIANIYSHRTGRQMIKRHGILRHPEFNFMLANIDRQLHSENGKGPGVLEIKAPGLQVFTRCKRDGLPDYYIIQIQHYLGVTGRKWGSFAVFNAERWELIHFDVERDDELINLIFEADQKFWFLVKTGTPPEELDVPALDLPPVGGEMVKIETPAWAAAVDALRQAKEIKTEAEALENEAKEELQRLMVEAGAGVVEGAGARIYWKESPGRASFDKRLLAKDHPEIDLSKYEKIGKPFRTFRPFFLNERSVE